MRQRRTPLLASSVALAAMLTLAACGSDTDTAAPAATQPAPAPTMPAPTTAAPATTAAAAPGTIVEVAQTAGDFTTLVKAVQAAGLVDTLNGPGPFTVLAPTDEAFAAALQQLGITADALLADKEKLTQILTYHVLPTKALAADVVKLNGQDVATVNGATVKITAMGSSVMVNDANVTATDVMASNGVIHVIDKVLIPA
jgi:transforming growth factor-beta-induced protein